MRGILFLGLILLAKPETSLASDCQVTNACFMSAAQGCYKRGDGDSVACSKAAAKECGCSELSREDLVPSCKKSPIATSRLLIQAGESIAIADQAPDLRSFNAGIDQFFVTLIYAESAISAFQQSCLEVRRKNKYQGEDGQQLGSNGSEVSRLKIDANEQHTVLQRWLKILEKGLTNKPMNQNRYSPSCLTALKRAGVLLNKELRKISTHGVAAASDCATP